MSLTVTLELSEKDIAHFNRAAEKARTMAEGMSNEEVASGAVVLLVKAQQMEDVPEFVKQRLIVLDTLVAMIRDEGWALSGEDAEHVRSALMYFSVAGDAIPDHIPVLGLLDDAIMIELCARELQHELEAYDDFCEYRQRETERRGLAPESVGRADWLDARRDELQERMRRRRSRDGNSGFGKGYGSSSGYASSRAGYTSGCWRPGMFKFG
ncbi:YkvA family protein [Agrilutibacter solisilvae]|uniref:DUF1232 domain-containing protein n=1 Tax=Agrilutibacter solisilvae TaxID=2763317 RepID=A0A974XXB0_9GAMM|nr:YkvA family protein [Lysobacter solisilvae]QSX77547.1 DUF1232 domain-containing protein [Lysobacter solisilvae]